MKMYRWNSVQAAIVLVLLFSFLVLCTSCHLWYQDLKGYLEYWTDTVTVQGLEWSASPVSQKNSSGIDTISSNATITTSVDINNPENYELNYELGTLSDNLKSIRLSGVASNAVLAHAKVTSSSPTKITVQIDPISTVITPESLALEHKDFTLRFNPIRSESGIEASATTAITFRYNTSPRMPLEVIYNDETQKLEPIKTDQWKVVQGTSIPDLDDKIYWAYPSGIDNPIAPDCVTVFQIYEDEYTNSVPKREGAPSDFALHTNFPTLVSYISSELAGYDVYATTVTPGSEISVYALDSEGIRSQGTISGRSLYPIILNSNGGTFGSGGDTVTIYKAAGANISGNDLDVPTRSGYYLSGWATTAGGEPISFPLTVSSGITLYALWTANPAGGDDVGGGESIVSYKINYNENGAEGGTVPASQSKQKGESVTIADNVGGLFKTGYTFSGWSTQADGGGVYYAVGASYSSDQDATLYALWTANPASGGSGGGDDVGGGENDIDYSITYNLDNGTNNPSNPLVYTVSQLPITLQAPTRSGYKFEGWYKDGNLVTEISLGTTGDITLTAKWSKPYDYYVDPAVGDDNNTGFSDSPLKTLQAAVDKIVADNDSSGTSFPYTINLLGDYDGAGAVITGESLIHVSSKNSLNLKISSSGGNYTINAGRSSSDTGRVLYIDNIAHVTLENITLTDGYISDGGGVYVDGGSLTLGTGAAISNNTATTSGGGIYLNGGSVTLSGNAQVANNTANSNGGGVYLNAGTFIMSDVSEISSNQASGSGGGVYVVSGATLSMDTSSSITNNTNSGMYGGGVYLAGTLTMTGGSISRNQSSSGAGVYANSAQALNMGGSAVITSDNDLQLGNGKCITITSSLTGTTPVATITPFNYTEGAQVLAADTGVTLADEVGKFGVVERDKISIWSIDDSGNLKTESITTTFPVVRDGDVAQSAQTVTISTGSKIGLPDSTTQDDVIAVLKAIVSSQHRDIILDLSRVTNLSEFRPTQDCYSNNGCPISVIIFPSSVRTIETAMFQLAYSITIYFMDVESTWNIQDASGQTQASFSVKENGGKSSSYLTSGYIWQKQ